MISSLKSFFKMNSNTFYVYFLLFPSRYNFEQYLYLSQNFIKNTSGLSLLTNVACNDFRKMKRICREIKKKKKETRYLIRVVINVNVQFKTTIY